MLGRDRRLTTQRLHKEPALPGRGLYGRNWAFWNLNCGGVGCRLQLQMTGWPGRDIELLFMMMVVMMTVTGRMVKIWPKVIAVSRLFHGWRGLACLNLIGVAQAECAEWRVTIWGWGRGRGREVWVKAKLKVDATSREKLHHRTNTIWNVCKQTALCAKIRAMVYLVSYLRTFWSSFSGFLISTLLSRPALSSFGAGRWVQN